ncbi:MAG: hypothetical protein IPL77_21955 [Flavobacteriales bacterium]|nr:hypothetical protein [Flavobacteriales bacterium]
MAIGNVPTGLARSGDHVFVTDRASDDLKVIDISDPANLAVVASLALGDLPADVAISGNYAYVLDNDRLKIIQLFCPNMVTMDPVTGELTSQAITESDPQVGANTTDRVPKWDGSALVSGTIADVAGKVGIGTTAPVSKLDVEGGLAVGAAYSGTSAAPANGAIIEGNVGIGTTAPEHKLDVNGIVRIKDHLTFNSANGVVNWGPSGTLHFRTLNAVGNNTGFNDRMAITASGNVGIGVVTPDEKLVVEGGRIKTSVGYTCKAGINGGYGNAFNFFWTGASLQGVDRQRERGHRAIHLRPQAEGAHQPHHHQRHRPREAVETRDLQLPEDRRQHVHRG